MELKLVDHDGVVWPQANLSTLPVRVRPAAPAPATPASPTYMFPMSSNAIPRGAASPPTTGVIVAVADADEAAEARACPAAGTSSATAAVAATTTQAPLRIVIPSPRIDSQSLGFD